MYDVRSLVRVSPSLADGSPKGDRRDDEDAVFRLPDKQSKAQAKGHAARRSPRIALAYTGSDGSDNVFPPPGVPAARRGGATHMLLGIPSVLRAASWPSLAESRHRHTGKSASVAFLNTSHRFSTVL